MPSASLTILNRYQGNAGSAAGTNLFTDLSGQFDPGITGTLVIQQVAYPIAKRLSSTTLQVNGLIPQGNGLPWQVSTEIESGQSLTVPELPSGGYVLEISATAEDPRRVQLDFDYGTTSAPVVTPIIGDGLATGLVSFKYGPGNYRIAAKATNFKYPTPQANVAFLNLTVSPSSINRPASSAFSIVGPILPNDYGYPDTEEWNLNIGTDNQVIASNVKMIMITAQGERVMNPGYGTSIRSTIFDMDAASIRNYLQGEIARALSANEPRVTLQSVSFDLNETSRSATITVQVLSLITQSIIPVSVTINATSN